MTAPREGDGIRALLQELAQGDGLYYLTQEAAFAPGISGEWPDVIPKPGAKHCGRLVKRQVSPADLTAYVAAHGEAEAERERLQELLRQGAEMAESLRLLVAERYPNHQHYLEADYRLGTLAAGFVHWRKAALAAPRATPEEGKDE